MQSAISSPLRIHSISHAAEGVLLFDLRAPRAGELAPFTPGAHLDLHMPGGLVRSYSLLNNAMERHRYVIGVKRDARSRGGSAWLHEAARAGALIEVSGPRNSFELHEEAPHSVLVAGGIGITPLWSMVQRLEQLCRPWTLHYRSKSRVTAALLEQLQQPRQSGRVHTSFSDEGAPRLDLAAIVREAAAGAHFYCCGPVEMLEAFESACSGVDPQRVHVEYFAAKEAPATGGGFTVRLARSGQLVQVVPGRTILESLEACGIDVPSACQQGVCGACETRVLSGVPDHRDLVLSNAERTAGKSMMVCCSGSLTDEIELDL